MDWLWHNLDRVLYLCGLHLFQSVLPMVIGLAVAVPLGRLAGTGRLARNLVLGASAVLYALPSLALFILLPVLLGTRVLDMVNIIVALSIYAAALLTRATVDALASVGDDVRLAAAAMGYHPVRSFLEVDLPLSLPVLFAGLRVVSVSNISLVSIGALIGIPNLGMLFTSGLFRSFPTEIAVGIGATLLLALLMDLLLVWLERLLTPWNRAGRGTASATSSASGASPLSAAVAAAAHTPVRADTARRAES